jgi:hypothetical protein
MNHIELCVYEKLKIRLPVKDVSGRLFDYPDIVSTKKSLTHLLKKF